jgi:predicted nucleotidyltransferase
MASEIEAYVRGLIRLCPGISVVWLIGSRANGTATVTSDYDLLVFADEEVFESLRVNSDLQNAKVDLLVVLSNNGDFETPSGEKKKGNLGDWEWKEEFPNTATYESSKFMPDSPGSRAGVIKTERLKGTKLHPP